MTDLELTKACAIAIGYKLHSPPFDEDLGPTATTGDGRSICFDPLNDDAQAMEFVRRFMLTVDFFNESVASPPSCPKDIKIYFDMDGETANHAICECIAMMSKP